MSTAHQSREVLPEPSGPGTVMLELGGDVGAAVVHTPSDLEGQEIEIRPEPGEWAGHHVAVRPRPLGHGRVVYAAVFPGLPAGDYRLRVRPAPPEGWTEVACTVAPARVVEVRWPGAEPGG